ncbi:MAG: UDP-N-acetylmuramoylalanyl-D-glutamyl-2,6-diaminopimelate--D-alanyl-D-alanyl ligase [Candidatus Adlerbacteria bacterium]|nr:UDP-N-acetylmuramoylalanyl-D-glutamyl-2,6-diaminopimelate--D-alanyl-D-alanyl ligase [Candidatus Adlerbacteria bacterium]
MRTIFKSIIVWILQMEAKAVLRKYQPKVVAITGSVGKTSTKDAVYAVLSKKFHVRKSEKSFNSEVGVPLTILGLGNAWGNPLHWLQNIIDGLSLILTTHSYPEWLVLEVGADRPGDIKSLSSWIKVDVAIITRLPEVPVHVEFFDSVEAVIEEKASLMDAVRPGGAILLYADDERTKKLQQRLPAPDARIVLFGFSDETDVWASKFEVVREEGKESWPIGMRANISVEGESAPVQIIGSLGTHAFLSAVAAAAAGHVLGVSLPDIVAGLEGYEPPPGRVRILPGIKDTLILDDTYNASPAATIAALDALKLTAPKGRAIAVLGDMLELGRVSVEEHRKVGAKAAQVADLLIVVGVRARDIAMGALDNGMKDENILQFEDSQKAGAELQNMLLDHDAILVKGSQSVRMERVVEEIMQEPERAGELLVRQDLEWKKR